MTNKELRKSHEAETQHWKDKLNDVETTELEKALIRHIVFQRGEAYQWREAFWRVEDELKRERTNRKGGMMI